MNLSKAVLLFHLAAGLSHCGSKETTSTPTVVYATVTLANGTTPTDNGSLSLTQATCVIDANSGTASLTLTGGTTQSSLTINIKQLESTAQTYTCAQAIDNAISLGNVGLKYDACSVSISRPLSGNASLYNAYDMYRSSTSVALFTYGGTCTLNVTSASSTNVVGSFSCTKLVNTYYQSSPVNPITTATPLVDASGNFKCQ